MTPHLDGPETDVAFAEAARRIQANPLGRLMYGQRELFHSNLIAWFFDELPDAADAVFRPLTAVGDGSTRRVDRERQNLDLVLHWPDRAPLVIENKVFSMPGREQLDAYASLTAKWKVRPSYVLLSLSAPTFELGAWSHLSYKSLAARILDELPVSVSYEVETMRRYATLVFDLEELVSAVDVRSHSETVWLPEEQLAHVGSSQMRAALSKARAQRVAAVITQTVPGLEQPAGSGLSNSTPLVESFEYVHTAGIDVHLGWQLQGVQFRRAVVYHDPSIRGHSSESRKEREELSRAHPSFFAFPAPLPNTAAGRKDFNHYAPNFVYRYVKTPNLTVGELVDAARRVHEEIEKLHSDAPADSDRPLHAVRMAP